MNEQRMSAENEALHRRLTEVMSAAGVPHSRAALEVLYMLPKSFLDSYMELFGKALKFADGTGAGSAGDELEKASGGSSGDRGKLPMVGAGGKRYKQYWVVKSDEALDLKGRIDKRLRGLARDIDSEMMFGELSGAAEARDKRVQCDRCGRIMAGGWNFCANCGNHRPHGEHEGNGDMEKGAGGR